MSEPQTNYQSLFEESPDPMWVYDQGSLRFLDVNRATVELYGFSRDEFLNMTTHDLRVGDDIRDRMPALEIARVVERRGVWNHRRKDGTPIWVEISSRPLDFHGYEARLAIARDVTDRKRVEDELKQSQDRFRSALEGMCEGVIITDIQGIVLYVNPRFVELTSYHREETVGRHVRDLHFLRDEWQTFHDRHEGQMHGFFGSYEIQLNRQDGVRIWVEVRMTTFHDAAGEISGILSTLANVDDRKRAERRLEESEQRYRSLFEHNPDAVYSCDLDGRPLSANPACETIAGYPMEEILEISFLPLLVQDDVEKWLHHFKGAAEGEPQNYETAIIHRDGHRVELSMTNIPITVRDEIVGVYGVGRDVTARKRAEERIHYQAYHDSLTGLPNRMLFHDRLSNTLSRLRRTSQGLAVLFMDLDDFKLINDTLGHAGGDQLLQEVAERLLACVRESDTVARMGGDEFTLLLPEIGDAEDVSRMAQRILEAIKQPYFLDGYEVYSTTCMGISIFPGDGDDAATLLRNADTALYRAKDRGSNNYELYTPSMNASIVERMTLERHLRRALECEEFRVFYQPQVSLTTGEYVGMEALVRWQSSELGLVSPGKFIPVAEDNGLIVPLGEWVLRTACVQTKAWHDQGYPLLRVAVNLSARQFREANLVKVVSRILDETGLEPQYLELELTENMVMQYVEDTISKLHDLKAMGISISIDDFGTGYSSLSYLKRFDISTLKIDQAFVRDIKGDPDQEAPNDAAIIRAIVALAHSLRLSVIAEGVETQEQLAFLRSLDCDEMQGYLVSRPVPAEEFEKLMASGHRANF